LQPHLGKKGGKTNAVLCVGAAFLSAAVVNSIPTSRAFTGGVEGNRVFLFALFPTQIFLVSGLGFAGVSIFFNLGDICEGLTGREALVLRSKSYLLTTGIWVMVTYFVFVLPSNLLWVSPAPWVAMLQTNVTILIPLIVGYKYLKSHYPTHVPSFEELKRLLVLVVIDGIFIGILPLSIGLYMTLDKWQPALVVGIGVYRVLSTAAIEKIALGTKNGNKGISTGSFIVFMLVIDMMYETYACSLLAGAKSGYALALPPMMDLGGNIGAMAFLWLYPVSPGTQFAFLVSLALREMVEMMVSIGVMTVFTGIYYFNRYDFYMIDVVLSEAFRNAWLMAISDFIGELIVFVILERMVYKTRKVSLFDLGQAYIRSIGKFEMFSLTACSVMYILMFMNYHMGCDYFFNFEWMTEENLAIAARNNRTVSWCELLQNDGFSCYNYDYTPMIYNVTVVPK